MWLAWNSPGYHNAQTQTASESATRGVNYRIGTEEEALNIKVTVCSTFGGWHCGQPASVPSADTAPPTVTVTTPGPAQAGSAGCCEASPDTATARATSS